MNGTKGQKEFRIGLGLFIFSILLFSIVSFANGAAPVINTVKLISTNCPSCDHRLLVSANDPDGNLDGCFVGSTFVKNNSAGECEINISDTTTSGTIWCNDTNNANVSYNFSFQYNDFGIRQSTSDTNDEGKQTFFQNDTISIANYCYQESANVSTSCGGLNTGTYNNSGQWNDGDWLTSSTINNIVYVNYSKPDNSLQSSLWQIKGIATFESDDFVNLSIPLSCWNANSTLVSFRIRNISSTLSWECFNITGWVVLHESYFSELYEEAMWWNISLPSINYSINYSHPSGYSVAISNVSSCYQESANVSTLCGGLSTGNYTSSGAWNDGDWSTNYEVNDTEILYINYSKPNNSLSTSLWQIKGIFTEGEIAVNVSINENCWNAYPNILAFRIRKLVGTLNWYCYSNTSNWNSLYDSNYNLTYEEAMWWNISSNGSFSGTLNNNRAILDIKWQGDWITSTDGTEEQDLNQIIEAGGQAYTKFTSNFTVLNLPNASTITLTTRCRDLWDQNVTQVSISESVYNFLIGCNKTDVITKSRSQWNITDPNVMVDLNSTGFMEILVNNTDTMNYTDVLVNASSGSIIPSGFALNDTETYFLNLTNGTTNLNNITIKSSSPLITERDTTVSDCTNYTVYTKYCIKSTTTDLGAQIKKEYWIKSFINNTNNISKDFKIFYLMPVSRFTDWSSRDSGSETYSVNSNSTNLSLSSDNNNITLLIDTSHADSSLEQGNYNVEIYYTYTYEDVQSGGGGGSETFITIKAGNWTQQPSFFAKVGKPGFALNESIVLSNPNPFNLTLKLYFQAIEKDPSWKWPKFTQGNFRFSEREITLAPGSYAAPYRKAVEFELIMPEDVGEQVYNFNIVSTDMTNSSFQVTRFSVDTRPGFSFIQGFLSFIYGGIALPRSVAGIQFIPTAWFIYAFVVILFIGIIYRIYRSDRKKYSR